MNMTDVTATPAGGPNSNWSPMAHLTSGYLGAGGVRIMATEGNTVHLVVWDSGVHYLRSGDAGESWAPKIRLADVSGAQAMPSIHRSGSRLHIIWQDGRDSAGEPYAWRVYYKRSTSSPRMAGKHGGRLSGSRTPRINPGALR